MSDSAPARRSASRRLAATDASAEQARAVSDLAAPGDALSAGRYELRERLGCGGMAIVYRVIDRVSARELALKQLQVPADARNAEAIEALFEHEFRTLIELEHPSVIRVYDYGIARGGPYYTMELLDGTDLAESVPLPWRETCALFYDVCSSLALLHSRRLLHRDVGPHNVRRTRAGRAKLIDFGAMTRMGPNTQVVGTPSFVAPEVTSRATLDGRTDLFSLGATLYYVLTGRLAYPARSFEQLRDAWSVRPPQPSLLVPEIPPRLDVLVMSLLSLEAALRPRTAAEVMLQLATLADLQNVEPVHVSRAYLSAPQLVAREDLLNTVKRCVDMARMRSGSSILLQGAAGSGRTRALDASMIEAKAQGAITLRAGAKNIGAQPLGLFETLGQQLIESLPEVSLAAAQASGTADLLVEHADSTSGNTGPTLRLKALAPAAGQRNLIRDALVQWILLVAEQHALVIAVDDVDRVDSLSGACLATLADRAKRHCLLLICSSEPGHDDTEGGMLEVLAQRSSTVPLGPLSAEQTEQLFDSVFGDVPHLTLLSSSVFRVAQGNPRASMELAQHLVDRGTIKYHGGSWSLPAQLDDGDLPATMAQSFSARVASLSAPERRLAESHALSAYRAGLSLTDHAWLSAGDDGARHVATLDELVARGVLSSDGQTYRVAHDAWSSALLRGLSEAEVAERHLALAQLGEATHKPTLAIAKHLLCGGRPTRALDLLATFLGGDVNVPELSAQTQLTPSDMAQVIEAALDHAESLRRNGREIADLQRWLCVLSASADERYFMRAAPGWLATLRRDSGHDAWVSLAHIEDAGLRLTKALESAAQAHAASSEVDRAHRPDEAIKQLVTYARAAIVTGSRTFDPSQLRELPGVLAPFATLSPMVAIGLQNVLASQEVALGRPFQARERWLRVFNSLGELTGDALSYVGTIRYSIAFGLGLIDAGRGIASSEKWAQVLDQHPQQKISAMYLRKVGRLQQGDWEGAERFRRKAELLAVQAELRPMFNALLVSELIAYAMASDLTGVGQTSARIKPLAERFPGWRPFRYLAEGQLALLRGDPAAAQASFEAGLVLCAPDDAHPARPINARPALAGAYMQALLAIGDFAAAQTFGERILEEFAKLEVRPADDVERTLALAQAKLRDYASAIQRLDGLIERQQQLGVTGLHLGATFEARARIAIWAGDDAALEHFGNETAREYRHGLGSPLGARYERLMDEAHQAGARALLQPSALVTTILGTTQSETRVPLSTRRALGQAFATRAERLSHGLRVACDAFGAKDGHLYLFRDEGEVSWTVSTGTCSPGTAELGLARECLDRALTEDCLTTGILTDANPSVRAGVGVFTEYDGVLHQAIVMTGSNGKEVRHVAALVLVAPGARPTHPHAVSLLTQVATQWLEAGDTPGVSAAD